MFEIRVSWNCQQKYQLEQHFWSYLDKIWGWNSMHHNDTKEERKKCTLSVNCSQSLSKFKVDFFMLVKTKSQNECFFLCISTSPLPHKEKKTKMVCVLMWWVGMEWPYNRPTWYCSDVKSYICATCRLCVISNAVGNGSPVRNTSCTIVLKSFC